MMNLTKNVIGKLFGDRGYIGQKLLKTSSKEHSVNNQSSKKYEK
jgi:hypothetical protein